MKFEVKLENVKEVEQEIRKYALKFPEKIKPILYEEAQEIMSESKKQCPVDTGALRASGYVNEPEETKEGIYVQMGYGGPSAPYAIYVHERLDLHHRVGKAKFLEDPVKDRAPQLPRRIASKLKVK